MERTPEITREDKGCDGGEKSRKKHDLAYYTSVDLREWGPGGAP